MADLSSLTGLTFSPDNYAENTGQFFVQDFSSLSTTGASTIQGQFPEFSNADVAAAEGIHPVAAKIVSVDTSASTPWGLGTITIQDIDSVTGQPASTNAGNPFIADIIGVNSGQILLGVEPYDSTNPTDPYDSQYVILSDSSLSGQGLSSFTFSDQNASVYQPPCFAAGTRIATPVGDVAVEAIAAGDLVLTLSGQARPVVWVGRRHVGVTRHKKPETVRPVVVEAGAFGEALPARDLVLSPDHAIYVDGSLIPVKYLVNGANVRALKVAAVTYHHIELADHDVVFAEGMPAETFLDTGNRTNFEGGSVVAAHPDFGTACDLVFHMWEARGFAPLVLAGPVVERARALLAFRAREHRAATRVA